MFESKAKIKVLIIGNDGISRKYWVEHDADFYDKKYKIDQDAIYQSEEKSFMGSKVVPTIMFRAKPSPSSTSSSRYNTISGLNRF